MSKLPHRLTKLFSRHDPDVLFDQEYIDEARKAARGSSEEGTSDAGKEHKGRSDHNASYVSVVETPVAPTTHEEDDLDYADLGSLDLTTSPEREPSGDHEEPIPEPEPPVARSTRWASGARPDFPVPEKTKEWEKEAKISEREIGEVVGSGGFGTTFWLNSDEPEAPPAIIKIPKTSSSMEEMEEEAAFYHKIGDHPNIVKCLGVRKIKGRTGLVMEGIKGKNSQKVLEDMHERYKKGEISHEHYWGAMQHTMRQTLKALAHLEKVGVVHNDIKPDNIMIDEETGDVKLIDFGLAHEARAEGEMVGDKPKGGVLAKPLMPIGAGTTAPELFDEATQARTEKEDEGFSLTPEADAFGAGGVAYRMGEGTHPLYGIPIAPSAPSPSTVQTINKIREFRQSAETDKPEQILKHDHDHAFDKAEGEVMGIDPITGESVTGTVAKKKVGVHGAETEYTKFVNKLMHPDPKKRLSATKALEHPFLAESLLDPEAAQDVLTKVLGAKSTTSGDVVSTDSEEDEVEPSEESKTLKKSMLEEFKKHPNTAKRDGLDAEACSKVFQQRTKEVLKALNKLRERYNRCGREDKVEEVNGLIRRAKEEGDLPRNQDLRRMFEELKVDERRSAPVSKTSSSGISGGAADTYDDVEMVYDEVTEESLTEDRPPDDVTPTHATGSADAEEELCAEEVEEESKTTDE
ncbi:MAG: protein kinase [Gemmataceae bacterium]